MSLYKGNSLLYFYAFSLFMVMSIRGDLSFTWDWSVIILYAFGLIVPFLSIFLRFGRNSHLSKNRGIVLVVIVTYLYIIVLQFDFSSLLVNLATILCILSIVQMPDDKKTIVLSTIKSLLSLCVGISLIAWALFLIGYPMDYEFVMYDDFHYLYKYAFFNVAANIDYFIIPRFSGMFLEPGQLAEPCVLMLIADGGKIKDWRNIILLVGVFLSFSLVGYALLAVWYFYKLFKKSKLIVAVTVLVVGGVSFYVYNAADENDIIYMYILSRLEYDEDSGIAGNNRVNDYADAKFHDMMKTSDCVFGIGDRIERGNDWTYDISGYKKFIIFYGIVGFLLVLLMVFMFYWYNKTSYTFIYLIITILAFLPRNLLTMPMWIFPVTLGFFELKKQSYEPNIRRDLC